MRTSSNPETMTLIDSLESVLGYASTDNRNVPDDAVTSAHRKLIKKWSETISMWLLSFILVLTFLIFNPNDISNSSNNNTKMPGWAAVLFVPMWYGSALQIVESFNICRGLCKRNKIVYAAEAQQLRPQQRLKLVEYESLPMMRKLFLYSILSVFYAFFIILSQIMLYLWMISGTIGMWGALVPILIIAFILLIYALLVNTCSIMTAALYTLSLLSLVLYGLQISDELDGGWILVVIPIFIMESIIAFHIIEIFFKSMQMEIVLSPTQSKSLCHSTIALILCTIATLITSTSGDLTTGIYATLPKILWLISICLFTAIGLRVFNLECNRMADSRGYTDPIPIHQSINTGYWEALPISDMYDSILLGKIPYRRGTTHRTSLATAEAEIQQFLSL